MKTVIYKSLDMYFTTPQNNYNCSPCDARKIQSWKSFTSAQDIIDYCAKWFGSSPSDFVVVDE